MTRLAFTAGTDTGTDAGAGGEAAEELAAFLGRLLRWDKAAVVRLRSAEGEAALGVFGHPPFGDVLAVKGVALGGSGVGVAVDATVSAGELLEAVSAAASEGGAEFTVPRSVTGPAWAGLLPPRGGWQRIAEMPAAPVRGVAAEAVAEFRARTEGLPQERRTRRELDALAEELWGRSFGPGGAVTLRVVHAAYALGFLRVPPGEGAQDVAVLLSAGAWVRLRTGYGSVAVRGASATSRLTVSPV
ncbi:hypothetical protein [Streptomyces sp.]|uniref:hypothetical protein n=1 Tax=Streptomyces sp. TaxID=1931 RepID=UPI002F40735B